MEKRESCEREVVSQSWCFWRIVWWRLVDCVVVVEKIKEREADKMEVIVPSWDFLRRVKQRLEDCMVVVNVMEERGI